MSGVVVERDGPVLVATIDRPAVRNAIDVEVYEGIVAAHAQLDANPDLHIGILTGAGGTFCAGMDLKAFAAGMRLGDAIVQDRPTKPMIAAVEGYALAGGFELVLACDLVVASHDASFGLPEIRRGLVAAGGGVFRLPKRLPYHLAMELVLTGDTIGARQAATLGLVNVLADPGQALCRAREMGARIGAHAPMAIRGATTLARAAEEWTESESWVRQRGITNPIMGSRDAREGSLAFIEKRVPRWENQ